MKNYFGGNNLRIKTEFVEEMLSQLTLDRSLMIAGQ